MTAFNPNPFANALNSNAGSYYKNFLTHTHDAKNLKVPDSRPFDPSKSMSFGTKQLTVPDTCQNDIGFTGSFTGFVGNTSLFACHDGTVIDFKTGKTVNRAVVQRQFIQPSNQQLTQQQSDEYWKNANAQSEQLQQNMSDEQKQMLAALENGKIMKLSRLVDDID